MHQKIKIIWFVLHTHTNNDMNFILQENFNNYKYFMYVKLYLFLLKNLARVTPETWKIAYGLNAKLW